MTQEELQAIRERCSKATPGPWDYSSDERGSTVESDSGDIASLYWTPHQTDCKDAAFISNARTDLPKALDEIERLRDALEQIYAVDDTVAFAYGYRSSLITIREIARQALEGMES